MKPIAPVFLLLLCSFFASAQNPLVKQWDKRYGGTKNDGMTGFEQTADGGYLISGASSSDSTGDKTQANWDTTPGMFTTGDLWLVKIDSLGNKQWDRRYGGIRQDYLGGMHQTADGGYIVGGANNVLVGGDVTPVGRGDIDIWLMKADAQGNKQWDKRFGGSITEIMHSLQITRDGGYILAGQSNSPADGDKTEASRGGNDFWIIKTDASGNKQWDRRFGGSSEDIPYSVRLTADGGYIIGGFTASDSSGDITERTRGNFDYWMVKIDSLGNKSWDKRFGGTSTDQCMDILQMPDGGYLLGGRASSDSSGDKSQHRRGPTDYWLVKTDGTGYKLWDKVYGGTDNEDEFGNLFLTADSGFLLAGTSYSPIGYEKTEANLGHEQTWVVKADAAGNRQWDKTLFSRPQVDDESGFAIETSGGCYLIGNSTNADTGGYKTQHTRGENDIWIVKFCDTTQRCNMAAVNISTNNAAFCASDSAQICAPAGMLHYLWNTGALTNCITTSQAGNYYVTVTDNNGCSAASNHLGISVYPSPPVTISVNGDTLSAYNAVSYQWILNGNPIAGATDSVYIANQAGNYSVAVTDTNGCIATSIPVAFTGIAETGLINYSINIYPNPATDQLLIETNGEPVMEVNIYNTAGKLMAKLKQPVNLHVNIAGFAAGIYVAEIKTATDSVMRRWVKM